VRHRLNRGANRQANTALYRIVVMRLRWHQPTREYLTRRTEEGLSQAGAHPVPHALHRPRSLHSPVHPLLNPAPLDHLQERHVEATGSRHVTPTIVSAAELLKLASHRRSEGMDAPPGEA
jgi:hypothetical protein